MCDAKLVTAFRVAELDVRLNKLCHSSPAQSEVVRVNGASEIVRFEGVSGVKRNQQRHEKEEKESQQ